jgi:hypothetical protein
MTNTYQWVIKKMDVIPNFSGYSDYVFRVYWDYVGTNPDYITSKIENYNEFNFVSDTYVDYNNLTEEEVTVWLESSNNIELLQSIIDNNIENIINPPIINLPLPWEPVPTTTTTTEPPPTTTTTTEEPTTTTTTEPPLIEETTTTTTEQV